MKLAAAAVHARLLAALCGCLLAGANTAGAASLVYEPFDYDADTVLDGVPATGQNLTGTWATGDLVQQKLEAASPGLDYGNLVGAPTPSGNRLNDAAGVTAAFGTVEIDQDVLVAAGDEIFWSALFTFSDALNGNHLASIRFRDSATDDSITFGEPVVGVRTLRLETNTAATGEIVANGAAGAFTDGQTFFVIGRYVNSAAPDGDSLDLIGYDTADADVLPGAFDPDDANAEFAYAIAGLDIDLTRIDEIRFTIRGTDSNFIDELRIGDSYASVVPEPTTVTLLALGLAAGLCGSRRRGDPGPRHR